MQPRRFWIIDDDPTARDLLTRTLEKADHVVVSASSAEEGLELARRVRPVLITLDIEMPGMNGWEDLSLIKAEEELSAIPVVMVSVAGDRETATASKAVDWLMKPVDRDVLLSVVRRHATAANSLVLVVEDDLNVAELIRRGLTEAGFRVAVAHNGVEGLDRVSDEAPGLILVDMMMPVMDGFEFVSILRAQHEYAGIPVVVVTAKDLSVDERGRLEGAVESVIEKRDGWETELLSRVAEVIPGSPVHQGVSD